MKKSDRDALVAFPFLLLIGVLFAYTGSQGGSSVGGIPLFALLAGLAMIIQWLAFIPAYFLQTEKFFDLTGGITFAGVTTLAVLISPGFDGRSFLLSILVVAWAIRLGSYLFNRIKKAGKDERFDEIKPSFIRFLNAWTIQGLWVMFTAAAALAAISTTNRKELDLSAFAGFLLWVIGFTIEVAADAQKIRFNANPDNKGKFIQTGLWSRSRHPNYFGEIVLWIGIALIALPVLQGWQRITLLSPVFVILLITRVSGVPQLETRADKKWGGQEEYEAYKKSTPVLIPRL